MKLTEKIITDTNCEIKNRGTIRAISVGYTTFFYTWVALSWREWELL